MSSAEMRLSEVNKFLAPDCIDRFVADFNKNSFVFNHYLGSSKLFELDHIAGIGRKMLQTGNKDTFSATNLSNANFGTKFTAASPEEQISNAIENLNERGSWIKLTRVNDFDASYNAILESIIDEIEDLLGTRIRQDLTWATMTLFLASPGITTPYHIDHESNFLFQIHGTKEICLYDANDRELLPDVQIENFYNGNAEAAHYQEEHQTRGTVYSLKPGTAVHHPPLAPHWVKNGDNISVSASIAFCMRPLEQRARIYQANFLLRKLGLRPRPPGLSISSDSLKIRLMSMLEKKDATTYREVVFAPMQRIKAPLALLRK